MSLAYYIFRFVSRPHLRDLVSHNEGIVVVCHIEDTRFDSPVATQLATFWAAGAASP